MVRYLGPKNRIARRFGANVFGRKRNPMVHKQHPPGDARGQASKKSDFGAQLEEKQKLRAAFGMITEGQLLRYYRLAIKTPGITPENLLRLLECRLDTVVYRLKLAPTLFAAHQLVAHGHVTVNGKKVDVRSFQVAPGMVVSVRERSRKMKLVQDALADLTREVPGYFESFPNDCSGRLIHLPEMAQIPVPVAVNVPIVCELMAHSH